MRQEPSPVAYLGLVRQQCPGKSGKLFGGQACCISKSMKPFATATVAILALVAILHLLRLLAGWSVSVNGIDIPMWVSVIALVVAGGLAVGLWRENA